MIIIQDLIAKASLDDLPKALVKMERKPDIAEVADHAPESPMEYLPVAHSSGTWVSAMVSRVRRVSHIF